MNNEEILKKAIRRAINGGWMYGGGIGWADVDAVLEIYHIVDTDEQRGDADNCKLFIFDHDFAKALWGDKFINPEMRDDTGSKVIAMKQTAWRHHLQQMVIAEDPVKYLGNNLESKEV